MPKQPLFSPHAYYRVWPKYVSLVAIACKLYPQLQVRWSDDYPSSWEPEEYVSEELIAAFAQVRQMCWQQNNRVGKQI